MKANDGHDEAKLIQLIVFFVFSKTEKEGGEGTEIVTSWEVSVLTLQKGSYLGCGERSGTQRISRSVFHKAKALSGHLQIFLTSSFNSPFLSSHFPFTPSPRSQEVEEISCREEEEEVRTG